MKKPNGNIFLNLIYEKNLIKKNIFKIVFHKIKVKKFKKNIKKGSPCFKVLWQFADFIKAAEEIFFYDNSLKNSDIGLYSSRSFLDGQNGFKISTMDCTIVVKLFIDHEIVAMDVERFKGNRIKDSFQFEHEQWTIEPSMRDELLLEQIIKIINQKTIQLFDFCYKNK